VIFLFLWKRFVRNAKLRAAGTRNPHVPLATDEVSRFQRGVLLIALF
jgi:hypothetical protein